MARSVAESVGVDSESEARNNFRDSAFLPWLGTAVAMGGGLLLWNATDGTQFGLYCIGLFLGLALYHAAFGFTTAWRELVVHRNGAAVRGQMAMLACSVLLFFPVLAQGELFGISVSGFVRPLGLSVIFGAFIFGIGMQLGNGCASGNLYHLGGGQIRAIPSMLGFMAGGLWATADYEWWTTLPQLAPISMIDSLGLFLALLVNLGVFAAITWMTFKVEKQLSRRNGADAPLWQRLLRGPWPFVWGGVALALLNFATLLILGRPWAVALAYPLWGAKLSAWLGMDQYFEWEFDFWTYWLQPGREDALQDSLLMDSASVMNMGIIVGAFLAACYAGKLSLQWRLPWQQWLAAVLGGLLLGYGATIAYGCNIGAYLGGISSGSLHGWVWLAAAFAGSFVGTRLRPLFRLPNKSVSC